MQLSIEAAAFASALTTAKWGLPPSKQDVEAQLVLLEVLSTKVTLTTFESNMRVVVDITEATTIEQKGRSAVPYKQLLQVVQALQGRLHIQSEAQALVISLAGEQVRRTSIKGKDIQAVTASPLRISEGETYTQFERVESCCATCGHSTTNSVQMTYQVQRRETQCLYLAQEFFARAVKQVAWVAPKTCGERPALEGVLLTRIDGRLVLIAGDAHCAVMSPVGIGESEDWPRDVLVRADLLRRARKALPQGADLLVEAIFTWHQQIKRGDQPMSGAELRFQPSALQLTSGNVSIMLALMAGEFPSFQDVFVPTSVTQVLCATSGLVDIVQSITPLVQENTSWMRLAVGTTLQAQTGEEPSVATHETAIAERYGPDQRVAFFHRYLHRALRAIQTPQVILDFAYPEHLKGGIGVTVRAADDQDGYRCVIAGTKVAGA